MSIDLEVYMVRTLKDLRSKWQQSFADCGMICEFRPDFDPSIWTCGDLIAKITVSPDGFPLSELYGERPFVAGCGIDIFRTKKIDDLLSRCPPPLKAKLKKAKAGCIFTTSMGRSPAAWRFQIFAAETLAKVTDGILYDPQEYNPQGVNFYAGDDLLKLAEREATNSDKDGAARLRKGKTFKLSGFRNWPQALKDSVPEYEEE